MTQVAHESKFLRAEKRYLSFWNANDLSCSYSLVDKVKMFPSTYFSNHNILNMQSRENKWVFYDSNESSTFHFFPILGIIHPSTLSSGAHNPAQFSSHHFSNSHKLGPISVLLIFTTISNRPALCRILRGHQSWWVTCRLWGERYGTRN